MKRVVENIEHLIGLKGATVMADVSGMQVTLLAICVNGDENADILAIVLPFMREKIKLMLRDFSLVQDAIIPCDWEGPNVS
jgi:hypothetical protein